MGIASSAIVVWASLLRIGAVTLPLCNVAEPGGRNDSDEKTNRQKDYTQNFWRHLCRKFLIESRNWLGEGWDFVKERGAYGKKLRNQQRSSIIEFLEFLHIVLTAMVTIQRSSLSEISLHASYFPIRSRVGKAGIVACSLQNRQVVRRTDGGDREIRRCADRLIYLIAAYWKGPDVRSSTPNPREWGKASDEPGACACRLALR